jgi:non-heme chloroperoxidase
MPYIDTQDGQQFFVRDIGRQTHSDQAPIILLHGFGMQSLHWLPFALPLAHKQRFIIPDLRGFGHSHHVDHDRDCVISNYADDLHDMVQAMGLKQFKLAGISMGAFVALQYQGKYGDHNVERYLHIDQSPKCINKDDWHWGLFGQQNKSRLAKAQQLIQKLEPYILNQTPYQALPKALRSELWEKLADFFADALSRKSHKFIARKVCANETLASKVMPIDNWPVYIHCLKAYIEQDYDMLDIIAQLKTPLTLLVGIKSEMYPCAGQLRIADHHNNCEVLTFPDSGHTPLIDQPFKFFHTLKRFSQA